MCWYVNVMTSLLTVPLSTFVRVAWRGLMGKAPFGNREDFFQYFQNTWLDGSFRICMWNVYSLEGFRTNNNTEGWHSKLRKLAGKAHPNIYEAVTLFQSEYKLSKWDPMAVSFEKFTEGVVTCLVYFSLIVASLFSWSLYFLLLLVDSPPAANCMILLWLPALVQLLSFKINFLNLDEIGHMSFC